SPSEPRSSTSAVSGSKTPTSQPTSAESTMDFGSDSPLLALEPPSSELFTPQRTTSSS
ncbi:hypothetical protein HDU79_001726, partial [Rhizoclosmatium sp. JEL0117]